MQKRGKYDFLDIFAALVREVRAAAASAYGELGLSISDAKLVRRIGLTPNISQARLARLTSTDPALAGRALQPLMQRGWIQRERSATDARQYTLRLTAAGKQMCRQVTKARESVGDRLIEGLTSQELAEFDRINAKLLALFDTEI